MHKKLEVEISVIISTYNSPEWLKKVIISYFCQTFKNFELIIADYGSTSETKELITDFCRSSPFPIIHVWQPDKGFNKCEILNKAILKASSNYIIMSDGDCIARNDFVETHLNKRRKGYFLSGGYFKLPMNISKCIGEKDIISQNCFDVNWLLSKGIDNTFKLNKLNSRGLKEKILNNLTTTKATWNGHNSSGWKQDMIKINGFNESMKYGGEDREFGERLFNNGIKSLQIRYSAICLHLDHTRDYVNSKEIGKNKLIRENTRKMKIIITQLGINKIN